MSLATIVLVIAYFRLCSASNHIAGSSLLSVSLILIYGAGECPSAHDAPTISMIVEVSAASAISYSRALKPSPRGQGHDGEAGGEAGGRDCTGDEEKVNRENEELRKEVEELWATVRQRRDNDDDLAFVGPRRDALR